MGIVQKGRKQQHSAASVTAKEPVTGPKESPQAVPQVPNLADLCAAIPSTDSRSPASTHREEDGVAQ